MNKQERIALGEAAARDAMNDTPGLAFHRCITCQGVVSTWDINDGGCPKCGQTKVRPTNLSLWEKAVQIVKHPAIWKWSDD